MAESTNLESKLGEVTGLAMAAQGATEKVRGLVEKEGGGELTRVLEQMHAEAAETEERCASNGLMSWTGRRRPCSKRRAR